MSIARDNSQWLADLTADGVAQQVAVADLRRTVLAGLRRGLAGWNRSGDDFLEDAAQESVMRILGRLDQFEGRSRFTTWATSIAIRVAISGRRRKHWRNVSLDAVTLPELHDTAALPADEAWHNKTILGALNSAIHTELTARQRTAIVAELRGMPQEEIARHLGVNRNTVYKITHDARKKLRRALEDAGYASRDVHTAFAK